MDQNFNLNENVDTLFHSLENFTQKEGLIGKPVTQGDKTFIPVVSVTMGYGGGNTSNKNQQPAAGMGNTAGGAHALGARLCTDAIIMIDNNNVSLMPMGAAGASAQLIEKIPQIVSGFGKGNQQQGQNQAQ